MDGATDFPIRAVVFDAVGTLITPDPPVATAYHRCGVAHGSRRTLPDVKIRFAQAFGSPLRATPPQTSQHKTSEAVEYGFWRAVVAAVFDDLPEPAADACFLELFAHFAAADSWRVYADVPDTLAALHELGLPVAVASNFDARLHGVFAGHAELAGIDARFVSSELGWRKPDARFFETVCDRLGLGPADVLYVGDDPQADLAGAAAAGLRSLLIERDAASNRGIERQRLTDLTHLMERFNIPAATL